MKQLARFIVLLFVAGSAVSLAESASSQPQTGPLALDDYWLQVQETLSLVDSLDAANAAQVSNRLGEQATVWEAIGQVKLHSGAIVPVDHSYLVGLLRTDPANLDKLHSYLKTLLDERRSLESSTFRKRNDYTAALSAILSRQEFNWETTPSRNPIQEALDKLWLRFMDWLSSLLPTTGAGASITQWIIMLVGALLLALVLVFIVRALVGSLSDESAWRNENEEVLEIISAEIAARRAEETARLGDYRSAVRWLYLSSLLILEERGLLRYDRTRTNREYLRSVAHLPELSTVLRDVIDVFDRVWYGIAPISEADFTRYAARVSDLRRMQ